MSQATCLYSRSPQMDFRPLDEATLTIAVRQCLLREELDNSVSGLNEIFRRSCEKGSLMTAEVMVGGLIVSTCRKPSFSAQVVDQLPEESRPSLRARLIIEFVHHFSTDEVERMIEDCLDLLISMPALLQDVLTKIVLSRRDDLFFTFLVRIEHFNFNFDLGDLNWLIDQIDSTHGSFDDPLAIAHLEDIGFLELIVRHGTKSMKDWYLAARQSGDWH